MSDIREAYGKKVHRVRGPFHLKAAQRDGSGNDGGILDLGIVGYLPNGRRCVVGEFWAMGPDDHGERVSYDVQDLAQRMIDALNTMEGHHGK